jgi:hypothetical protein
MVDIHSMYTEKVNGKSCVSKNQKKKKFFRKLRGIT